MGSFVIDDDDPDLGKVTARRAPSGQPKATMIPLRTAPLRNRYAARRPHTINVPKRGMKEAMKHFSLAI
jgi:hypothetical protein